ncbi:MAG: GNAT family N-acetyltransferase [Pseudomonadota bacterium]
MTGVDIRDATPGDFPALAGIFHAAVRDGAAPRYSAAERAAWSPAVPDGADWAKCLASGQTVMATRAGRPVGFMTLIPGPDGPSSGMIDLAYVLPAERGRGTAEALYAVLEGRARADGLTTLRTDASRMAEPFFARLGWTVEGREVVTRRGVGLARAAMSKVLSRGLTAA